MEHAYDYLIVGAGMAADAAVGALRENDANARIGLIGDDPEPPYERPPLSKGLWREGHADDSIDLGTARHDVGLHLGRQVTRIDRANHTVHDAEGDSYRYRRLLLATGARTRMLDVASERVIHFRTHADYLALRCVAVDGAHVVVVGGGFIGSELAAALVGAGCRVTMLFPGDSLGAGRFSDGLAAFLDDYYREHGVELRAGVKVSGGQGDDHGVTLELDDGSRVQADVVVVGIGVVPNTELAEQAGLRVDDGIVVDARLRTNDPDIWAAGDVARFHAPALDMRLRVEHENAAISMGHHAGRAMAGDESAYTTLPFFYSDLFDLGFEAVGLIDARHYEVVEHWAQPYRQGVVYYMDGGRVRGVLLWNVWGQVDAAREVIASLGPHDGDTLRHRIPIGG